MRTRWTLVTVGLVIVFGVGTVWAGELTIPNEFIGGTKALASEVNENFDYVEAEVNDNDSRIITLETAVSDLIGPHMWYDLDPNPLAFTVVTLGPGGTTVHTLNIDAPGTGAVVINGNIFVDSQDAAINLLGVEAKLDAGDWVLVAHNAHNVDGSVFLEFNQYAYTHVFEVSGGAHTITIRINPVVAPMSVQYNLDTATAVWYPSAVTSTALGVGSLGDNSDDVEIDLKTLLPNF